MKRRISLLLAVVMVLGSFGTVFAADTTMTEEKAAAFLDEKGILKGNMSGDLQLEKNFLRRDSVIMLSRLMGVEDKAKNHKEVAAFKAFKDITDRHYNGYISWAVEEGYFVGKTATKFGFNEHITTRDYSVVLLRALGYGKDVEGKEGWEGAFDQAKKLGLTKGLELKAEDEILRGQMALMTVNALNTKVKGSEKTLAEELGIEMPKPEVLEAKVYANNLKEVEVAYNKEVNEEIVTNKDRYSLPNFTIESARMEGNVVILSIVETMKNNTEYKLTINGVDKNVDKEYSLKVIDNELPKVVNVEGLGTKGVKVTLSEPVKPLLARDFRVNGASFYGSVSQTGREIFLKPYSGKFKDGENTLTVNNLVDFNNFTSPSATYTFNVVEDTVAPVVVNATASEKTIVVEFDKEIDKDTVNVNTLFHSGNVNNRAQKVNQLSGNKFEFVFANRLPLGDLKITVRDAANYSGYKMVAQDLVVKVELDTIRPKVVAAKQEKNVVTLTFNKNMSKLSNGFNNELKANYNVYDKDNKRISSVNSVDVKGKDVVVTLYSSSVKVGNVLKVTGLRDDSVLQNTMEPFDYAIKASEEVGDVSATTTVQTYEGEDKDKKIKEIRVVFDKDMNMETVVNPANYQLVKGGVVRNLQAIGGRVEPLDGSGRMVVITLDTADVYDHIILGEGLQSTNKAKVNGFGTQVKLDVAKPVELTSANLTDSKTVELTFNNVILAANRSAFTIDGKTPTAVKVDGKKVVLTFADTNEFVGKVVNIDSSNKKIENILDTETINKAKEGEVEQIVVKDKVAPTIKDITAKLVKDSEGESDELQVTVNFAKKMKESVTNAAVGGSMKLTAGGKAVDLTKAEADLSEDGKILTITAKDVKDINADDVANLTVELPANVIGENGVALTGETIFESTIKKEVAK